MNNNPENTVQTAKAIYHNDQCVDVMVTRGAKQLHMLGAGGATRELTFLPNESALTTLLQKTDTTDKEQARLPVLIGAGVGFALKKLITHLHKQYGSSFSLAIVDNELDILSATKLKQQYSTYEGIHWITGKTVEDALADLTHWQATHGNLSLQPFANPFYLRLNREFYSAIADACTASAKSNFWEKANYTKFSSGPPRILLLTSKYFLMGEIIAACERLHIPHLLLTVPDGAVGQGEFVEQLLQAVVSFKPDFVFTLNHLGVDREGVLISLLEQLRLPLASWFVDNPHLVLHMYSRLASPWTTIFTWDADNIATVKELGFSHVEYLPLGTDALRFTPNAVLPNKGTAPKSWYANVSFVGNSMVSKVSARMDYGDFPPVLQQGYKEVAAAFSNSDDRSVRSFLQTDYAHLIPAYDALETFEKKLAYETMLTWEATLQYRLSCVTATLPFTPLIVGDTGWHDLLPSHGWLYHSELNYYSDLPVFYSCSHVNFNCTSKQMKGAVNQRVFDVPATGSFLLTDFREQISSLFELNTEVICYHTPEEATELLQKYVHDEAARKKIVLAARKRIFAEHTYEHRVTSLLRHMQSIYG